MRIGSTTSMNNMSAMQTVRADSIDPKNKKIQKEITDERQQMRALSSKEDLSVAEKADERKALQKKIASLNNELNQQKEEFRMAQKRELVLAKLQEQRQEQAERAKDNIQTDEAEKADASTQQEDRQGSVVANTNDGTVILKEDRALGAGQNEERNVNTIGKPADASSPKIAEEKPAVQELPEAETDKTEPAEDEKDDQARDEKAQTGLSNKEIHAIVSADTSVQQAGRQDTVIARINGGVAILKGEIQQNEIRGIDTEKKQAELEKMEQKEERARIFQSAILNEANHTMASAAKAKMSDTSDQAQTNTQNNAFINAFQLSQQEDLAASQQMFNVSFH